VSERLVQQFVHNVRLWTRRVVLLTSLVDDSEEILRHVHLAIDACVDVKVCCQFAVLC